MSEVLKRFEMIKNAIMLEDEEIVFLQITKLSQLSLDSDANHILNLLKDGSLESVINLIENYRQSQMGLMNYEDQEIYGLRLELKILETELENLSLDKVNLESLLNDFNNQYYHSCGQLIESVLQYRSKIQQQRAQANPENEEKFAASEEAQRDYNNFHKEYSEALEEPPIALSKDDQAELKTSYRKASRLCHPDKVSNDIKDEAAEVFKRLSEAYKAKDLSAVKNILESLQRQKRFVNYSDNVGSAEKLRKRVIKIRADITSVSESIKQIKADETYQTIITITSWEEYFKNIRDQLTNELIQLKETLN